MAHVIGKGSYFSALFIIWFLIIIHSCKQFNVFSEKSKCETHYSFYVAHKEENHVSQSMLEPKILVNLDVI